MTTVANPIEIRASHTASSAARTRVLIVADDLTGACDSAVAFLATGRPVRVLLDASQLDSHSLDPNDNQTVLALSTESRDLSPSDAAARVSIHITQLAASAPGPLLFNVPGTLLFKKIDSAARGPFAAEILASLRASSAALALVTPAFPDAGRTVSSGTLTIRDWSGQDAAISLRDLFSAEDSDDPEDRAQIATLPTGSTDELHRAIIHAIDSGARILLCDAAAQSDLDRLAAAALRIQQPLLWCGSAGLARALSAQMPAPHLPLNSAAPAAHHSTPATHHSTPAAQSPRGRTLLFTGTPHPVTALQLAHLDRSSHTDSGAPTRPIHRIPESGASPEAVIAIFTAAPASALILTGGDTAAFVLRALGARSIRLAGEVAPGIPWGIVEGGLADGSAVVTKSGGFGAPDALLRAFEFCESAFCELEGA